MEERSTASAEPTATEIRAALEHIVASKQFRVSPQLAAFLRFVVLETLAGRGDRLKAYTIAVGALGRDETFDPQTNPIVRVDAGRLRIALKHYYITEGHACAVHIDLPIGSYTPSFKRADYSSSPAFMSFGYPAKRYPTWRELIRKRKTDCFVPAFGVASIIVAIVVTLVEEIHEAHSIVLIMLFSTVAASIAVCGWGRGR
jgi:hypothetical protein